VGHVRSHEAGQGACRDIGHDVQTDSAGRFASNLHGADNDRFVTDFAPTPQAGFRTADVGLIDLDLLLQRLAIGPYHGAAKLLQHHPGRLVPPDPQLPLELEGREAWRLGRYQIGRPEPLRQRDPGSVQDGPSRDRRVVPAGPAPPQEARRQLERFWVLAPRTSDPLGPSAPRQVPATRRLIGKELPKLVQRPRIFWAHPPDPIPWGWWSQPDKQKRPYSMT
jgi:hypothetical protein